MDIAFANIKKYFRTALDKLPPYFEKYEAIIILFGALVCFLLAGLVFYTRAYKVVNSTPEVNITVSKVNYDIFEKTLEELNQRKIMAPDLPIIDPFQ